MLLFYFHLPCCALIRFYSVRLSLTLSCPYFIFTYPAVRYPALRLPLTLLCPHLFFCALILLCTYRAVPLFFFVLSYPAAPYFFFFFLRGLLCYAVPLLCLYPALRFSPAEPLSALRLPLTLLKPYPALRLPLTLLCPYFSSHSRCAGKKNFGAEQGKQNAG